MTGQKDLCLDRILPLDPNGLLQDPHILPVVLIPVLPRVLRIDPLNVKVHIIHHDIGNPTCHMPIMTNSNPRGAWQYKPRYIHGRTHHMHLPPH